MNLFKKIGLAIGTSVYSTLLGGLIGVILVVIGVLLSLTVIGALIGIPLIVVGLFFLFSGPLSGLLMFAFIFNNCPNCHKKINYTHDRKTTTCRFCKTHLLIQNKQLVLA